MLLLPIDRSAPMPVYRQICDQVARLVDEGALVPGDRLPPTRRLAGSLAVHRSTVIRAYGELRALGYVESRPGSYSTIRRRFRPPGMRQGAPEPASLVRWPAGWSRGARLTHAMRTPFDHAPGASHDIIDFARHAPDPALAPHDYLRRCARRILAGPDRRTLTDYADPQGLLALREVIARRMAAHGVAVTPEEIVVTNGVQHAFDLVLRLLVRPGGEVVTEAPTYSMALALLRLHGARPLLIPMREDGMDLDVLRRTLVRRRPSLLFTMPNFQNPTGITTTQSHREAVLSCCETHRLPIVEDGFDEELKYAGATVLPIKSIDARGIVLYLGTLSKIAFPGLRIGWIAAPRQAVARLTAIQRVSALGGNVLAQAVAAQFYAGSEFEVYLRRMHRVYQRRLQAVLAGLDEHLPEGVQWTRPEGGYTLWLSVPDARGQQAALGERLERLGVKVTPGSDFFVRPPEIPHFRLSISCADEAQITEGCRRIGRALRRGSVPPRSRQAP